MLSFKTACRAGVALGLCLSVTPAFAQDQQSSVEEIIVTASKRGAQNLQDVPAAIQAFSAEQIEDFGAVEFTDLATRIPGLTFQDQGPGDREYIIRGVNSRGTATTGVYFDEAVITARHKQDGGGRQADIELHDLARIEVLKGPQGTLYGASSLSGTIRFIPNAPDTTKYEGRAEGTVSNTRKGEANYHVNAMVNVPVVEDKLAVRAVGWLTRDGGYIDNDRLGLEDINDNNVEGGRISAKFNPTPELSITTAFLVQDREVEGSSRLNRRALRDGFSQDLSSFGFEEFPVRDLANQEFTINNWEENLKLYSGKIEYDAGFGTFLATTNYFTRDIQYRFDSTPILFFFGAPAQGLTFQPQSQDQWSSEIRFSSSFDGPFNFVAGGFYLEEDKDFEVQVTATNDLGLPLGPFNPDGDHFLDPTEAAIFGREKVDNFDQFAFFGEATIDVTDALQFILGIRYFEADIDSFARITKPFVGFPPLENPFQSLNETQHKTTYKAGVNYKVNEDILLYFQAASGFRIGGTNEAFLNPGGQEIPATFAPDFLWNYELGFKSNWFDDRLTLNAAFYLIRWEDVQIADFDPSNPFPFIDNAPNAGVDGLEVEVQARPIPELDLFFGASYQNARFRRSVQVGSVAIATGDDIPFVPEFQANGGVRLNKSIGGEFLGVAQFDFSYTDSRNTAIGDNNPDNIDLESYTLLNAKIGVETERWQANLFVRNLIDKRAEVDLVNTAQDPLAYFTVRPRTFGINVSTHF